MGTWDEAAEWYLSMAPDESVGFNHLAADIASELLGDVRGRLVLDVGAGEGTFARRLLDEGAAVIATEPTRRLRDAITRDVDHPTLMVRPDSAESLTSIESRSIDACVYVLVLHHVVDLDVALSEAHRVLRSEGSLVVVVPHPWTNHDAVEWTTSDGDPRIVVGSYTSEGPTAERASDSVLRALGWQHRTMASWLNALIDAGFVVDRVVEPVGDEPRRADGGGNWRRIPRFLAIAAHSRHDSKDASS